MVTVTIEKVDNGYIVETDLTVNVYPTLDEALNALLWIFESRRKISEGQYYGKVSIERDKR